jgi:hypothetical protein
MPHEMLDIARTMFSEMLDIRHKRGRNTPRTWDSLNHDSLFAHVFQCKCRADRAPIKFHGAANAVYSTAENDDSVVVEGDVVCSCVVGCVLEHREISMSRDRLEKLRIHEVKQDC